MASIERMDSIDHRLSNQLHLFSELSEVLTLRLLDLELRVNQLEKLHRPKDSCADVAAQELLEGSEERVRNLRELLNTDCDIDKPLHVVADSSSSDDLKDHSYQEESGESTGKDNGYKAVQDHDFAQFNEDIDNQCSDSTSLEDTQYVDDPQMPLLSA